MFLRVLFGFVSCSGGVSSIVGMNLDLIFIISSVHNAAASISRIKRDERLLSLRVFPLSVHAYSSIKGNSDYAT